MSLVTATRSETTKQFTTAIWWILVIVLFAYVAFTSAAIGWVFSASATGALPGDGPRLPSDGIAPTLYSTATAIGYVFPLLIGTLMVTTEFRHKTLTPTFLATPRRATVLWAKLLVGVLLGILYGIIGVVAAVAPAAGFLAGFGLDTDFTSSDTWAMFGRMLIAYVLWVIVGIGVGVLVRNQVGAIVGVLVFTQFLEPVARLAGSLVKEIGDITRLLPGAASDALVGASIFSGMGSAQGGVPAETPLEWWAGGLVLLGYALVVLVIGYFTSWRRDVS
ncbi:ABC transporter permease subunit [Microbacterium ulmi]|uniref:ABC transporter permease subunit n=1 Tax=Microbacterium ulmi TaxID=179095 RepID=A0A7Y2M273_9MICO|nr:ABC transporter permease subunit [Microbacterium ulmi]NII69136.1 hypothetical protein [Microbacterium ulmi]NNH05145.1 ABC transporter permease subunit [Microbacterium ulmi]